MRGHNRSRGQPSRQAASLATFRPIGDMHKAPDGIPIRRTLMGVVLLSGLINGDPYWQTTSISQRRVELGLKNPRMTSWLL